MYFEKACNRGSIKAIIHCIFTICTFFVKYTTHLHLFLGSCKFDTTKYLLYGIKTDVDINNKYSHVILSYNTRLVSTHIARISCIRVTTVKGVGILLTS